MNTKKVLGIILLVSLFLGGVIGGYFYFSRVASNGKSQAENEGMSQKPEDLFSLRIYYPVRDHLQVEERRLPRRTAPLAIAEATVEQYLKGPVDSKTSSIPRDTKILGIYKGADRILYVDLSDDLRRNFSGDALTEFLLLKGLYQSIIANVEDVADVKVLIEGKELETLGGHLYLMYPLKDIVSTNL
ncbi:MAG TPA: GerMN domain-containing protein [Thermodesulfovibrionales bacterium]|nr:GerMN domain-containing protein [Thermodesulfovibrionales bacterium]